MQFNALILQIMGYATEVWVYSEHNEHLEHLHYRDFINPFGGTDYSQLLI